MTPTSDSPLRPDGKTLMSSMPSGSTETDRRRPQAPGQAAPTRAWLPAGPRRTRSRAPRHQGYGSSPWTRRSPGPEAGVPRNLHRDRQGELAERRTPSETRGGDEPAAAERVGEPTREGVPLGLPVPGRVELRDDDILGGEPARDRRNAVGGEQQEPRRDHQDRRHRDLRRHQDPLASAAAPSPWARRPWEGRRPDRRHQQRPRPVSIKRTESSAHLPLPGGLDRLPAW